MRAAKRLGTLGLMLFAALGSQFAVAQAGAGGAGGGGGGSGIGFVPSPYVGWYAGGNIGQSKAKIDDAKITSSLLGGGLTATSIVDDHSDTGYKIFAGYQFNKNFALEGGYYNLGKFGFNANTVPAGTLNGSIKLQGLNLDAVGIIPINEKFSVFGRAGIAYAEARDSFSGTGAVNVIRPNPSKNDTNYKYGFGLQYDFNKAVGMRAEAERYRVNDAVGNKGDVDLLSVGLIYRFGAGAK